MPDMSSKRLSKWNKDSWKIGLAAYLKDRRKSEAATPARSCPVNVTRSPINASMLNHIIMRRVREDRIEEAAKLAPVRPQRPTVTMSNLKETCFSDDMFLLGRNSLLLRCLQVISENLQLFEPSDLAQYFSTAVDADALYALSAYSTFVGTMADSNVAIFAQPYCERLVLGNISEVSFSRLFPSVMTGISGREGDLGNLGASSTDEDGEEGEDWERMIPKPVGCFSLRCITFVKSHIGSCELRRLREAIPLVNVLRFVGIEFSIHDFFDVIGSFLSLEELEISYSNFMTIAALELLRSRIQCAKTLPGRAFTSLKRLTLNGFVDEMPLNIERRLKSQFSIEFNIDLKISFWM
jgi:hypothetical protein